MYLRSPVHRQADCCMPRIPANSGLSNCEPADKMRNNHVSRLTDDFVYCCFISSRVESSEVKRRYVRLWSRRLCSEPGLLSCEKEVEDDGLVPSFSP
jgi:hypothetical protein